MGAKTPMLRAAHAHNTGNSEDTDNNDNIDNADNTDNGDNAISVHNDLKGTGYGTFL
jgi:hypothetical protein